MEVNQVGGRYYITGVQIGMLRAFSELGRRDDIKKLLDEVEKNQFVKNVDNEG